MNKEQILHDIALAYTLYQNLADSPISAESFFQEYEKAINDFKHIVEHYNA